MCDPPFPNETTRNSSHTCWVKMLLRVNIPSNKPGASFNEENKERPTDHESSTSEASESTMRLVFGREAPAGDANPTEGDINAVRDVLTATAAMRACLDKSIADCKMSTHSLRIISSGATKKMDCFGILTCDAKSKQANTRRCFLGTRQRERTTNNRKFPHQKRVLLANFCEIKSDYAFDAVQGLTATWVGVLPSIQQENSPNNTNKVTAQHSPTLAHTT